MLTVSVASVVTFTPRGITMTNIARIVIMSDEIPSLFLRNFVRRSYRGYRARAKIPDQKIERINGLKIW